MKTLFVKAIKTVIIGTTFLGLFSTFANADQSLDKQELISKISKLERFNASFKQQVFALDGKKIQDMTGEVAVAKPNLLRWQINTPDESLIVSDGANLWLYDVMLEQVSIYTLQSSIANTPILLLTSTDQKLWQDYLVTKLDSSSFIIKPIKKEGQITSLSLNFNGAKLTGFETQDQSGQVSKIALSNIKAINETDAQIFAFTSREGITIDDQR